MFFRNLVTMNFCRFNAFGLLLTISFAVASAQMPSIGIKGGYQYIMNISTIRVIAGSTDCGVFSNGNSSGFFGGLTGDYSILGDALELTGAVVYSYRPAQLSAMNVDGFEVLDPNTNTYVPMVREHTFTSSLGYIVVEMGLRSRPLDALPIYLRAAFDAGNPIVSANYTQTEEITSPSGVLFPDGTQRRSTGTGEFPGLGTAMGLTGAIGAALAVSKHVELCPEIFYRYGLNTITSTATWKQSYAGAGLQIRYRMFSEEQPPPPPPPPPEPVSEVFPVVPVVVEAAIAPPPPEPVPAVIASVRSQPLEIRETVVTQTFPLLPYVFFDSASTTLRSKYIGQDDVAAFSEMALPKQTLPIYYRMLDIIGARLRAMPTAVLTIMGTTDGSEGGTAEQRSKLASSRAQSVLTYLTARWNISTDRLKAKSTDRPALVSNEGYSMGVEENRRVELTSNDGRVLDPVVHTRFNEYVPVQAHHNFSVDIRNPAQSASWAFDVNHRDRGIGSRTGSDEPPALISFDLSQEMTDKLGPVVGRSDTLDAHLNINQRDGVPVTARTRFPVIKTVSNYEVSRLSLIVFDFDRADISQQNKDMMLRVVKSASGDGSVATIVGSTDRLGELQHNMNLSTDRAVSVESFVRSIAPSLKITEVKGIGPAIIPYSNDLPEGRFYCRTVSLTITTPLREK